MLTFLQAGDSHNQLIARNVDPQLFTDSTRMLYKYYLGVDGIENTVSKNYSIAACLYVAAVTCL
jgi:hypothetical protein